LLLPPSPPRARRARRPYHVIKYADTGFCQIWDNGIPTAPWPVHYTVMTHRQATLERAVAVKGYLLHKGYCNL
jgi:hypothetical protein